ncbi:MAG TPA: branched-chain amino acid ABC transporter permease [Anaerolineaceae bacterium]|jgi:branched-chain amino acid transport system permease protein|nr:branched-chain amino acid ABC transporter permease [Anaerolineaceae bacterium]HQJ32047.1 branched-chain amino acid ABC transporter permease [Anaerolineaceae bacterium]
MKNNSSFLTKNRGILIFFAVMLLAPFLIGLFEGSTPLMIWGNQGSLSKFIEGLGIEIFILALFALSFDLLFGITGLLSFGHAMFFAVAAYLTGIALKTLAMPFWGVVLLVLLAAIVQALLFSLVLPRVKGITFTLVSLGLASVFHIIVMSSDMINLTGADVGLQGVPVPAFISPVTERLRFYVIALTLLVVTYLFYRRFVASPTGRVCVAIRENEDRAKMLGYNTTIFKVVVMIISSLTAATAGMLHALYQPSISPSIADLGFTVTGLLIVLIGGVGTLSGAIVGAFAFRLLDFTLRRFMGESASFITGAIYVIFVLFVPYGIVGTMRMRQLRTKPGWQRLLGMVKPKN